MYSVLLFVHSYTRWFVLLFLVLVLFKFLFSWILKKPYTKLDKRFAQILLGFVHIQFIIGLILYFKYSAIVQVGLSNMKLTMKNTILRYWTVEHIVAMFIFTLIIQLGFSFSKRAFEDSKKHKHLCIACIVSLVILIQSIPWPMKEYGRALFRHW